MGQLFILGQIEASQQNFGGHFFNEFK